MAPVDPVAGQALSGSWKAIVAIHPPSGKGALLPGLDLRTRLRAEADFDGLGLQAAVSMTELGLSETRLGWTTFFPVRIASLELAQEIIFAAAGTHSAPVAVSDPLSFRVMYLDANLELGRLSIANYLTAIKAASDRDSDLELRDALVVQGETDAGIEIQLTTECVSEQGGLSFRKEVLAVDGLTLADATIEAESILSVEGFGGLVLGITRSHAFERFGVSAQYGAEVLIDKHFRPFIRGFEAVLTMPLGIDAALRYFTAYGHHTHDRDGDGLVETHFGPEERQFKLNVSLDRHWEMAASFTSEPIVSDMGRGAPAGGIAFRPTHARLLLQRARVRWNWRAAAAWSLPEGHADAPLSLSELQFRLSARWNAVQLTSTTSIELPSGATQQRFEITLEY